MRKRSLYTHLAVASLVVVVVLASASYAASENRMQYSEARVARLAYSAVPISPRQAVAPLPDELTTRLHAEYGAVRVAGQGVVLPPDGMFASEQEVTAWQAQAPRDGEFMLQTPAGQALRQAQAEAQARGLRISPRDTDAAARTYQQTLDLWRSRMEPGLDHWVRLGLLSGDDASRIRALPVRQQVDEILKLEDQGLFFNLDFSRSILSSVAPPGASQHLALLAFDVKEHDDARVRTILARHGWFQTVVHDRPHFTYLGVPKSQLEALGLSRVVEGRREYWVPRRDPATTVVASR
jgi:hypothetical protein